MFVWNELSLPSGKRTGYDTMVGADAVTTTDTTMFLLNSGSAATPDLPFLSLLFSTTRLRLILSLISRRATIARHCNCNRFYGYSASLWVDYIFLDTDERRRFAQLSHEYLIEQLQFTGEETVTASSSNKVKLNFNHPVKELVWVTQALWF
jgi:hypothetical protein